MSAGVMSKFLLSSVKISYIHSESSVIWILWGSISWTTQLKVVWKASYMELNKVSQKYFFHVDGQLLQVCKTFFLDTLSVSDQTVRTTLQKLTGDGHLLPDQRRLPPLTSCKRRRGKRWEVIFGSFKQYRHIIAATHPQNSICQKLWPWPRCTDCT